MARASHTVLAHESQCRLKDESGPVTKIAPSPGPDHPHSSLEGMRMATADATSVYLFFDKSGILIYVGITSRGIKRQREHEKDKPWWQFTSYQEIEHYDSREEALEREAHLIAIYLPPFNTQHNPNPKAAESYMALALGGGDFQAVAQKKRIPLRIATIGERFFIAVTPMEYAKEASTVSPTGDFAVSVPGAKVKGIDIKRVGSSLAVKVNTSRRADCRSGSLMFRNNPYGRDIKRIDFSDQVGGDQ